MKRRLTGSMVVLLLAATSAAWASCPEGQEENQRTGNCQAIPGWAGTGLNFDGEWSGHSQCDVLMDGSRVSPKWVAVFISGGQVNQIYAQGFAHKPLKGEVSNGRLKIWGQYYAEKWKAINLSGKLYNDTVRLTGWRGPRKCVVTLARRSSQIQDTATSASAASSSSKNLIWCVTSSSYNNKYVHQVTRAGCTSMVGKVFTSKSLAEAEHQRLKGTTTASSSQWVWCATASSVLYMKESSCNSSGRNGKSYSSKHLAQAEHQRLKGTTAASSSGKGWCATASSVLKVKELACRYKGGKSYATQALAQAEHQRLKEAATPVVKTASLTVRSNVKDDRVYIDGNFKGSTRLDLGLPKGKHTIRIEKDGYEAYEETVNLTDNLIIRGHLEKVAEEPVQTASAEIVFWQSIQDSDDPDVFRVYLDEYPTGKFSKLAELRIKKLGSETTSVTKSSIPDLNYGNYHALVIGNNDYDHLPKLKTAVNDAGTVASVLRDDYGFSVKLLKNANRSQMLGSLAAFRKIVSLDDNFLLYYAGHGYLDEAVNEGYWLPVDAEPEDPTNWLQNDSIVAQVKGMQAKQVMVVADSCFSGTMTRGLKLEQRTPGWLQKMLKKKSRTALTSGGLEPVMDSGSGDHSVFAKAFIRLLKENGGVLAASQLFSQLRPKVMVNSDQTPEYGNIHLAGHDGGDFLFVRR